jgi:hypothetical protein
MTSFIVFLPLAKVDTAKRLVYGMLGAEIPDKAGEIFDYESARSSPRDAPIALQAPRRSASWTNLCKIAAAAKVSGERSMVTPVKRAVCVRSR